MRDLAAGELHDAWLKCVVRLRTGSDRDTFRGDGKSTDGGVRRRLVSSALQHSGKLRRGQRVANRNTFAAAIHVHGPGEWTLGEQLVDHAANLDVDGDQNERKCGSNGYDCSNRFADRWPLEE